MDDISALLGIGYGEDDSAMQMRNLAHQLRGQQEAGNFFSAMPGMETRGQQLTQGANQNATRVGRLNRAMGRDVIEDEQFQTREDRIVDEAELQRKTALENAATRRAHELERDRLNDAAALERAQAKAEQRRKEKEEGGLTAPQLQTGLNKLNKKLKSMQDVFEGVNELDESLAPYAKGGAKEGENIPGVGLLEGSRSWYGDIIRSAKDMTGDSNDAQDIFRKFTSVISKKIKEDAGLAQTLTETQNVLKSAGLQEITSEESALRGLEELKRALLSDQQRVKQTTLPQVLNQYNRGFQEGEETPLTRGFQDLDFSNRYSATEEAQVDPADELSAIDAEIEALKAQMAAGAQ